MHGVPLLRIWTKFQKFTLMLIRKVSEIGVVICSKNIKQRWEESKRNLAPVRKILNLIIYCKTLQKNGMKLLYHMMINRSKNCKRLRLKKAIQTMYDNKLWRLLILNQMTIKIKHFEWKLFFIQCYNYHTSWIKKTFLWRRLWTNV